MFEEKANGRQILWNLNINLKELVNEEWSERQNWYGNERNEWLSVGKLRQGKKVWHIT
jgi:hypothetical protein